MHIDLCRDSRLFDFHNPCVRDSWSALVPALFALVLCLSFLPIPRPARRIVDFVKVPFKSFLTIDEAEALDQKIAVGDTAFGDEDSDQKTFASTSLVRTLVLASASLVEALVWLALGCFRLIAISDNVWAGFRPILVASSWIYAAIRPIASPPKTAPYDLFFLYLLHLFGGILLLGGVFFDGGSLSVAPILALVANLAMIVGLLAVVLAMPLAVPSKRVKKDDIVSPLPSC